jgi:putative PEP-CTERM system histidine kinase
VPQDSVLHPTIGYLGHGAAALAFTVLSVLFAASPKKGRTVGLLVGASIVTALWASVGSLNDMLGLGVDRLVMVLDDLRATAWIAFLLRALLHSREAGGMRAPFPVLFWAVCLVNVVADSIGVDALLVALGPAGFEIVMFGHLLLAVCGLYLNENLLRNTRQDGRYAVKFLCLGLGALFAFDLFVYSEALLFRRLDPNLLDARGFIAAIVVPLIALSAKRSPTWSIDVFVSRQVVFHSATLIGAGLYLLLMSAAGYYVRQFGGEWGPVVQATFLFAAVVALAAVMFSGSLRARARIYLIKNFYNYKYDYRREWLRFTEAISSLDTNRDLAQRVTQAMAGILDCPEGALWLHQDDGSFVHAASWNCRVPEESPPADPSFVQFLEETGWVVVMDELARYPDRYHGVVLPEWLSGIKRAWLLVPLIHHERLTGVVMLGEPRAQRDVNWEDFDLLKAVGRQAASYLAEQQLARALAESRQFSEFNRRFAFVIHDIKNLVSQLSLVIANAQKYRDDPRFQDDMLETIRESVEKKKRLLVRLHEGGKEAAAHTLVELTPLLRRIVEKYTKTKGPVDYHQAVDGVSVMADPERLGAVIAHILDNAFEAANDRGPVRVSLSVSGPRAVIEIADNGSGMTAEFMRDELFRPFRSSKKGGYGIGAYESREFVKEIGGRLDVLSEVGKGTTVRIGIPVIGAHSGADKSHELLTTP